MADAKEQMTKTFEYLKQLRDELQVQLHLAKADAKDEWARLEKQWEEMRPKLEAAREEARCVMRTAMGRSGSYADWPETLLGRA